MTPRAERFPQLLRASGRPAAEPPGGALGAGRSTVREAPRAAGVAAARSAVLTYRFAEFLPTRRR
ncbi:hypothetical protein [Streptomyces sp. NPDC056937]|uniref:hypothetical protein n=1 Tax=unclassified Streptomyces TaxID=2593676 RepID=UPI00363122B5